jgi:hypothetical protein
MHERGQGQEFGPGPMNEVVRSLATREGIPEATQRTLALALLPVALSLSLLGFLLGLAGLCPLSGLLVRLAFSLLRPALSLLLFVAGEGTGGLFRPALELVLHVYSFPKTSLCTALIVTAIAGNTLVLGRAGILLVHLRLAKLASLLSSGFSPSLLILSTALYDRFVLGSICPECSIPLRKRLLSALMV